MIYAVICPTNKGLFVKFVWDKFSEHMSDRTSDNGQNKYKQYLSYPARPLLPSHVQAHWNTNSYFEIFLFNMTVKALFTLSHFSVSEALRCRLRGPLGPHRSDAGRHRIESGYTVLNRRSPGSGPGDFKSFKTTGAHRDAGLVRGITVALPA